MNITEIPFVSHVDIQDDLTLDILQTNQNHLKSIHAGAQFTLAESASGAYLSSLFPKLKDKVIPLLRESNIKFKKQALTKLRAFAHVEESNLQKFKKQFDTKGRGVIKVSVELKDQNNDVTAIGTFSWYISKI